MDKVNTSCSCWSCNKGPNGTDSDTELCCTCYNNSYWSPCPIVARKEPGYSELLKEFRITI